MKNLKKSIYAIYEDAYHNIKKFYCFWNGKKSLKNFYNEQRAYNGIYTDVTINSKSSIYDILTALNFERITPQEFKKAEKAKKSTKIIF